MRGERALKFKQVPSVLLLHARTEAALFAGFGVDPLPPFFFFFFPLTRLRSEPRSWLVMNLLQAVR